MFASAALLSLNKMVDVEMDEDFEFDAAEDLNYFQQQIRLASRTPRETLNHFMESVLRSPPRFSTEEAF